MTLMTYSALELTPITVACWVAPRYVIIGTIYANTAITYGPVSVEYVIRILSQYIELPV